MIDDLPNVLASVFEYPNAEALRPAPLSHPPRILLLRGSLRSSS